jgi:ech hydrogenase subunit B
MIGALTTVSTIIAALLLAPLFAGLIVGADRKLSARLQGRTGPPLFQPFYDIVKLFGKERLVVNPLQILFIWLHLFFAVLALVLFVMGRDLIIIIFLTALGGICLVLGAMSSNSPYSQVGSQREIMQMSAYEPILLLLAVASYMVTGGLSVQEISSFGKPLLVELPLFFVAMLLVIAIKMKKSPLDISASRYCHQEIVRGVLTEYSGPLLAMIELASLYELALLLGILGMFWATNIWVAVLIVAAVLVLEILIDNTHARMSWQWMMKVCWIGGISLSVLNLAWLYF